TDQHDLEVKMRNARKFLLNGDKVKINLRFSGREIAHQDLGLELLQKVTGMLEDLCVIEQAPKKEGRQMFVMVAPDAQKIKDYEKANKSASKESSKASEAKADS